MMKITFPVAFAFVLNGCSKKKDDAKIVGGKDAKICDHGWQVRLTRSGASECGGVLIDSKWVLTSGSCVETKIDNVFVGDEDTQKKDKYENEHKVKNIYRHENYGDEPRTNDIALLELEEAVKVNKCVKTIEIGPVPSTGVVEMTGWGGVKNDVPNILQVASFKLNTKEECVTKYDAIEDENDESDSEETDDFSWINGFIEMDDKQQCASGQMNEETGKKADACDGDYGGPVTISGKLVGIISFGLCATDEDVDAPVLFVKTSEYKEWIDGIKSGTPAAAEYCPSTLIKDAADCSN